MPSLKILKTSYVYGSCVKRVEKTRKRTAFEPATWCYNDPSIIIQRLISYQLVKLLGTLDIFINVRVNLTSPFLFPRLQGLAPGSGIFVVCDATNGAPLAIFQENRFLTDLRTGAAGAVSVKYFAARHHKKVGFIGAGVIAQAMARGSACVHEFDEGFAYGLDTKMTQKFADEIEAELGYKVHVCATPEEAVRNSDVIFTQTPGGSTVLELDWLRPHATIIASGSDQPTKNEIPAEVQKASKMVCDLVRQCKQVGELRSAIKAGLMKEEDVYAEIGEVVNGDKPGRTGEELILVDLTGTGAQDAAIGQVAWDILSKK